MLPERQRKVKRVLILPTPAKEEMRPRQRTVCHSCYGRMADHAGTRWLGQCLTDELRTVRGRITDRLRTKRKWVDRPRTERRKTDRPWETLVLVSGIKRFRAPSNKQFVCLCRICQNSNSIKYLLRCFVWCTSVQIFDRHNLFDWNSFNYLPDKIYLIEIGWSNFYWNF